MFDDITIEKIISASIRATKFFLRFQLYHMDIVPSCNLVQYQGNIIMQPWENGKNPNFGSNLNPPPPDPPLQILSVGFIPTSS